LAGGLITVADLDARQVDYGTPEQAQAAVADASAVARAYVAPVLDAVEAPDAPAAVVAVVVGMVRRVLTNPRGLAQESLGDYAYTAGPYPQATLLPTNREKRMLRQAAAAYATANSIDIPSWGASGVYQQSDLPAPPAFIEDIVLPSDQD
jgi:hypothetical protein